MNSKLIIFFLTIILLSQGLNLKKRPIYSNTSGKRYFWKITSPFLKNCDSSCDFQNGYSCYYGIPTIWIQCTKTQEICFYLQENCKNTGCNKLKYLNIKQNYVFEVIC